MIFHVFSPSVQVYSTSFPIYNSHSSPHSVQYELCKCNRPCVKLRRILQAQSWYIQVGASSFKRLFFFLTYKLRYESYLKNVVWIVFRRCCVYCSGYLDSNKTRGTLCTMNWDDRSENGRCIIYIRTPHSLGRTETNYDAPLPYSRCPCRGSNRVCPKYKPLTIALESQTTLFRVFCNGALSAAEVI
jgi:hypothetical protein